MIFNAYEIPKPQMIPAKSRMTENAKISNHENWYVYSVTLYDIYICGSWELNDSFVKGLTYLFNLTLRHTNYEMDNIYFSL